MRKLLRTRGRNTVSLELEDVKKLVLAVMKPQQFDCPDCPWGKLKDLLAPIILFALVDKQCEMKPIVGGHHCITMIAAGPKTNTDLLK